MMTFSKYQLSEVAEIKLLYQPTVKAKDRPKIFHSSDAVSFLHSVWDHTRISLQEEFKVILLNNANRVLGILPVGVGSAVNVIADPKLIFSSIILSSATGIILAHNHPSGNIRPSGPDIALTKRMIKGAEIFDITVLDYVIITEDENHYFSFADDGLI